MQSVYHVWYIWSRWRINGQHWTYQVKQCWGITVTINQHTHIGCTPAMHRWTLHNYNNNNNRFMALCLWQLRFRSFSSFIYYDPWHPACSIYVLDSLCRTFHQVLFGVPLGLEATTSYSIHFFTQSLSSHTHMACAIEDDGPIVLVIDEWVGKCTGWSKKVAHFSSTSIYIRAMPYKLQNIRYL